MNISSTLAMMVAHVQGMLPVAIQVRHTCIITVSMSVTWHLHVFHILLMNENKKSKILRFYQPEYSNADNLLYALLCLSKKYIFDQQKTRNGFAVDSLEVRQIYYLKTYLRAF